MGNIPVYYNGEEVGMARTLPNGGLRIKFTTTNKELHAALRTKEGIIVTYERRPAGFYAVSAQYTEE